MAFSERNAQQGSVYVGGLVSQENISKPASYLFLPFEVLTLYLCKTKVVFFSIDLIDFNQEGPRALGRSPEDHYKGKGKHSPPPPPQSPAMIFDR